MAKGFGAIMAAVAQAQEAAARSRDDAVACPLCGGLMTNDGAGWFCYQPGTPGDSKCPEIVRRGWVNYDGVQGLVLGVVVDDNDQPLVKLFAGRGGFGRTNIKVDSWEYGRDAEVPSWIKQYGWVMNTELLEEK